MSDLSEQDSSFHYPSYEEFRTARLKLNYESTLKLWHSLPTDLSSLDAEIAPRHTSKEQRARIRRMKFFAFACSLFGKTRWKAKIHSKGFRLWNETLGVPSFKDPCLYRIYQSLGRLTTDFLQKGETYDREIGFNELYKAGRTVWYMIAFQMQLNLPLTLTDSIFGYNMLYPYTDDLVDSNSVSREAKKHFAELFHKRLVLGELHYDPQAHFNGTPSDKDELQLPPSLKEQADRIVKIFDMVKFIENDWKRGGSCDGVYMSLGIIHDAQMKSTLQHARPEEQYEPTMEQIEQITAEKGGACIVAAGFLIEGRLTRTKMAYLEYLGFAFQLLDDLQDVQEDLKNNDRTVFTQCITQGLSLDAPTARLIQYCYAAPAFATFPDDQLTNLDSRSGITLAHYIRLSMMKFSLILIFEAASRLKQYYSKPFLRELSSLSPIPLRKLQTIRVEEKIWSIVRNQWF